MMVGCSEPMLRDEQPNYLSVNVSAHAGDEFANEIQSRSGVVAIPDGYDLRYVVEAWSCGDEPKLFYRGVETVDDMTGGLNHSFRIIEGEYDFLFWADYVVDGEVVDNHYDTSGGLTNVTIKNSHYMAGDLSRDCFAECRSGVVVSSSFNMGSVELVRPMAMLVVKNSDASMVQSECDVAITLSKSIPNGYNVLSGEVIEREKIMPLYPPTTATDDLLAFDYIFLSEATTYDITMKVGEKVINSDRTPFEVNKKTNVISNFFN